MSHVFIGHVAEDRAIGDSLRQALTDASYETWIYTVDTVIGQSWVKSVREGLANAAAVVFVISPRTFAKPASIHAEIARAHRDGLPHFTILVDLKHADLSKFGTMSEDWDFLFATNVPAEMSGDDVTPILPRLFDFLRRLGLRPTDENEAANKTTAVAERSGRVEAPPPEPPRGAPSPAAAAATRPGALPPGYELDEFTIERVLGQGGFGITYLARYTRLERLVAIKEYFPQELALRTPDHTVVPGSTAHARDFHKLLEDFLTEAKTLVKLRHPGIVKVERFIEALGTAYMVMEYEEGRSLQEVLTEMRVAPTQDFIKGITTPLMEALAVAHAAKILHRDIKPQNIVIRSNGSPVLLDFGAARSFQSMPADGLTIFWSGGYTPPEQRSGDLDQGPWTDIYAVAAVLYRVIGSQPPPDSLQRLNEKMPMLSAVQLGAARYNPRLLQTIDWGLCLGTRERPQSIEEWRRGRDQWPGVDGAWDAEKSGGFKGKGDGDGKSKGDGKDGGKGTWTRYAIIGSSLVVAIVVANGIKDLMYPDPIVQPTPVPGQPSPSPVVAPEPKPLSRGDERHIAALGMVNGTIGSYRSDPDLLLADLRADARNQVLEKAAAIFVERGTLNTQYDSLRDEIFNHVQLVEELSDDAQPQWAGDGLVYLATRAVVRMQDLRRIVFRLSREKRIALIRAQGDPLISVAVSIRDAERGSPIERSALAENVIKQRIREFGFRVASPSSVAGSAPGGPQSPSFAIESEAKLKRLRATLPASGLTIEKYALTSWTVKCVEHSTGEDIYFDNQLPEAKSWGDEDRALQEIGTLIADAFSRDFFAQHLPRLSRQSQLVLTGVQSSEALDLIARELMGLRSVVDVEPGGAGALNVSWYDQGPGGEQSFDAMVLAPLRRKLGADCFQVTSDVGARQVGIRVSNDCAQNLVARLEALPTSALCEAPAQRLAAIAPSPDMMEKVYRLNPGGVGDLAARGNQVAEAVVRRARAGEI